MSKMLTICEVSVATKRYQTSFGSPFSGHSAVLEGKLLGVAKVVKALLDFVACNPALFSSKIAPVQLSFGSGVTVYLEIQSLKSCSPEVEIRT